MLSGPERLNPVFETSQEKAKRMEKASARRHIAGIALDRPDLGVITL
ncbi:MAG: hypothetical protein Metus_1389 [Candidatus Methanosuratincola subterraneus]|uniref:Uncharacterized protein n=1 Tax=Methanosuratincola subterraneus TaxID=2593994 RepID=A0A444L744_METS7|nr:MAG: hypothetical protein Metus_1389 [Candidatus Methanosuratincola subterraneus]